MVHEIRGRVLKRMDLSRDISDEEIIDMIAQEIAVESKKCVISIRDRVRIEQQVFNSLRKMDAIQDLMEDPAVTEIMVNGPDSIFYEKDGCIFPWDGSFSSEERLQDILQQIVAKYNRVINRSSPIVDTRLEDGSRVNIVLSPISVDGSALTIRKFPQKPYTMERLIEIGSITREAAEFLEQLVQARYSIIVSGGTGAGKTTVLNALSNYIPKDERIITIEDSAELQIQGIKNLVRLETRNANMEGVKPITIRDLIKTALRMRPDRILIGECRGEEAFDLLQAMNVGHEGSLSTLHANSCKDALSRLEMMVLMGMNLPLLAIRQQIASGIDIIVQLGRLRDKRRCVLEISEVIGMQGEQILMNPIFRWESGFGVSEKGRGCLKRVGSLCHEEKRMDAGLSQGSDCKGEDA